MALILGISLLICQVGVPKTEVRIKWDNSWKGHGSAWYDLSTQFRPAVTSIALE